MIDDIDRLLPDELRQMLTLIKSLGNLPNITYLLAYDQAEAAALLKRAGIENAEYMDKIVQVSFQLPRVDRAALQSMFFSRMDVIRQNKELKDMRRWGEAFIRGIDPYIRTPRDVTRLCNSLQITWPAVEDEVDWGDLIVLEVLRLHEPGHYRRVLDNLDLLTGEASSLMAGEGWAEALKPTKDNASDPERLKSALTHLFPRLAKEWKGSSWDGTDEVSARRDRRLRSPDYARNYFALSPSPDQFSASELKALVTHSNPEGLYQQLFERALARRTAKGLSMVSRLLEQITEEITSRTLLSTEAFRT